MSAGLGTRTVTVLGATGSIGTQTVELLAANPQRFRVRALVGGRNAALLAAQARALGAEWAVIGDGRTGLRITVDRATAPLLGMLTHRKAGGRLFCQLQLSALELDDTSKPGAYAAGPRRFRFGIEAI